MLQRRIDNVRPRGRAAAARSVLPAAISYRTCSMPAWSSANRTPSHTYWVMPIRVANRDAVLARLRAAGFDATARSSLIVVPTPKITPTMIGRSHPGSPKRFLPGGEQMPDDRVGATDQNPAGCRRRRAGALTPRTCLRCPVSLHRHDCRDIELSLEHFGCSRSLRPAAPAIHPYYETVQNQILARLPFGDR